MKFISFACLLLSLSIAEDRLDNIKLPNTPSENFLSINFDNSNFAWIGSDQGLIRYDGIDVEIFRSNPFSSKSLSGNRVWFLDNYNSDTLTVITDNAIHLYSKKNYEFEQFKIASRPTNYFRHKNDIWVTTLSGGVYKLSKNKKLDRYKFEPLNPFSISSSNFESNSGNKFAADLDGNIWLATSSGLNKLKLDNSVRRFFKSNTNNKLLSEKILTLYYSNNNILFVGTEKGLNYYSLDTEKFTMEPKLKNVAIFSIDKIDENIFIFTSSGIFKKTADTVDLFMSSNIFSEVIANEEDLLFWKKGSNKISYNRKSFTLNGLASDVTLSKDGEFIISTSNGLVILSSRKLAAIKSNYRVKNKDQIDLKRFYDHPRHESVNINYFDSFAFSKKDFWFISSNKISKKSLGGDKIISFEHNPRNPNTFPKSPSSLAVYKESLWVGSSETGLYEYDLEKLNLIKHYQFDINDPNSLQTSLITCLLVKNNELWIGSGGDGLFLYSETSNGFSKKSTKSGLSSNLINDLFVVDGILFVLTQLGLNYLVNDNNYFRSINSDDGLKLTSFNNLQFWNNDDRLIIKSGDEQYLINLSMIKKDIIAKDIFIKSIVGIDSKNKQHLLPFTNNQVNVPPYITSIDISVSSPSLHKAKQNLYSYSYGSSNESETFTNKAGENISIPKRGYSDKVLKIKSAGLGTLQSQINFNYIPPWYFTWWAITSYTVFTIGGIYLFTTLRAKKLQQQMEESRRSEELEEARDLQLKLLAKKVPEMKNVEVETYIRTATEVGGDYYDFFELDDGTLIAACGDATGHGATSGMMVSITKAGLKGIQKRSPNKMLTDLNNIVKSVEIGRIRMSLNLLEFKNGHVNISSAAMPPVYHFSKKKNAVNEIELVGTPLGSFYDEEFDKYQVDFEDGDALVLMSDGLPEAPNHTGEMLDYPAVKKCIKDNGSKSASDIKDSLIELSDNWLDGIQNPDDITLVIFKKKESGGIAKA